MGGRLENLQRVESGSLASSIYGSIGPAEGKGDANDSGSEQRLSSLQ